MCLGRIHALAVLCTPRVHTDLFNPAAALTGVDPLVLEIIICKINYELQKGME